MIVEKVLNNNVVVVSFDFLGHGDDKTDFSFFTLSLCIEYLEEVIKYTKDKYNVPVCLFGSGFGGYVILIDLLEVISIYIRLFCCVLLLIFAK